MAQTSLAGNPVNTVGDLPSVGSSSPSFTLTKGDLSDLTPADLAGKRVVINIFPSLDTKVCAMSVRKFNELASGLDNTTVLCVSADLPFAQGRFCAAEGLSNVITASTRRRYSACHSGELTSYTLPSSFIFCASFAPNITTMTSGFC